MVLGFPVKEKSIKKRHTKKEREREREREIK
jgi:hypothetical protein